MPYKALKFPFEGTISKLQKHIDLKEGLNIFGYFGTYTLDGQSALYENCARNSQALPRKRDIR